MNNFWHKSINEIGKDAWNNLLDNNMVPFYTWDWLNALEKSESISLKYGWQPLHLSLWENNELIAVAPLYIKNHSYGEFIFDNSFARLAEHLGLRYYPKLIGMSPLSPAEGYQFIIKTNANKKEINERMLAIIDQFAIENKILSTNFLYVNNEWKDYGKAANYSIWINKQTLWKSNKEKTFEDYLMNFNSNQRKNIKKERRSIKDQGIKLSNITGDEINLEILERMHDFYEGHCAQWGEWGSKYLTKRFFVELAESQVKENIVIFQAHKENIEEPIAMSFCTKNSSMLWGRYWGSKERIKNLHFELCFYSPIDWSISKGLKGFDPGAGGSQKLRRGCIATRRFSLHRWYDKRMEDIIKKWLPEGNSLMEKDINASNNEVPFKN